MSRVTIGKLAADFNSATFEERQRTKDIEVVPRQLVLDIIKPLDCDAVAFVGLGLDYGDGCAAEALETKKFIGQRLQKFEEGEEA